MPIQEHLILIKTPKYIRELYYVDSSIYDRAFQVLERSKKSFLSNDKNNFNDT